MYHNDVDVMMGMLKGQQAGKRDGGENEENKKLDE